MAARRTRTVKPAEVRRDEILDATEAVVLADGPQHLKVDAVAGRADIAVGTIYRYFGSKDDLVSAARTRYVARWATSISEMTGKPDTTSRDKLRRTIALVFDFSRRNAALHHALFRQAGVSEEGVFTSLTDAFSTLVTEGVERDEFDVPDVAAATAYVVHGLHGLLITSAHDNDGAAAEVGLTLAERTLGVERRIADTSAHGATDR